MQAITDDRSEWPEQDLEKVGQCPYCGSSHRGVLLEGLEDLAFRVAPGRWTMWSCHSCSAAYLDPRPTIASIGRAYERYYTHRSGTGTGLEVQGSPLRRLVTGALLGRLNRVYGHALPGAAPALSWLAALMAGSVRFMDTTIRHLPAPRGREERLLDIGCGSGDFLRVADRLGYRATGIDLDPMAVEQGRAQGLDMRVAPFPGSGLERDAFAQITMSHVLEHLHDPVGGLREALSLLVPGGRLWLSQPNLGALGLRRFGVYWRGLEPPRHLTLVDTDRLVRLLGEVGFTRVTVHAAPAVAGFFFRQSLCQQQGIDPYGDEGPRGWDLGWETRVQEADTIGASNPRHAEILTVTAHRPD